MMRTILPIAMALFVLAASEQPVCQNLTVSVPIRARNGVFPEYLKPNSSIDLTDFFLNLTQQGFNFSHSVLEGYTTISGSYNITGTYCAPANGTPSAIQILTHGVGFDRSYWNLPFNNFQYSYVNEAVAKYGFATFAYDRLGIGESRQGDPLNFVQTYTEIAALESMTTMIRNGSFDLMPPFTKVLHVGHSYGSIQTVGALQRHPQLWDGVALTGYSTRDLYFNFFELGLDAVPVNASLRPAGYVAPGGLASIQEALLAPNAFDPAILPFLDATGNPATIGELLTLTGGSSQSGPPTSFTGPALVITGERDLPFCGGNALQHQGKYTNLPAAAQRLFPQARNFTSVIVPGTAHGLNLQFTYSLTYAAVNEFFIDNGVGPW